MSDGCVVHQDVDPAEGAHGGVYRVLHVSRIGNICCDCRRCATALDDLGSSSLGPLVLQV
jgi:hypothetical protein